MLLLRFYKVMSVLQLLYGSGTRIMNERNKYTLQTNEMRFLRLIMTEQVKTNKKRNTYIREELKTFDTNIQIVNKTNGYPTYR